MRCFTQMILAVVALAVTSPVVQAENKLIAKWTSKIEADPSKTYTLDRAHGPWMVMVASFHSTGSSNGQQLGKTPAEAAQGLVLELRQAKIPAYMYEVKGKNESVTAQDNLGREQRMKNLRVVDAVCVVAGNYPAIDDAKAQQTLKFIKQYKPKCLETGVDFVISPGRPGPLSKAFLTPNPLLTHAELEAAKQAADPLLMTLNSGEQFSLYENTGTCTLMIAKFSGKTVSVVNETVEQAERYFNKGDNDLNQAAATASSLVRALRSREPLTEREHPDFAKFAPYARMDAYIWHDRLSSYVTVGTFDSPTDPKIQKYIDLFATKTKVSANGQKSTESHYLPVRQHDGSFVYIPFEPVPQLMMVPHVKK